MNNKKKVRILQSQLATQTERARVMREALELAWRDIFDWEATVSGLRGLIKRGLDVEASVMGTERGEKESEKVRKVIWQALNQESLGDGGKEPAWPA